MNIKLYIGIIIIFVGSAFGISKFHLFVIDVDTRESAAVSERNENEGEIAINENKVEYETITPVFEAMPDIGLPPQTMEEVIPETNTDNIEKLRLAVESGDEFAVQTAIESAAACEACIFEMIQILDNPSYDNLFRKQIARALIKSGDSEGIKSVVKSIIAAHNNEDQDFKDELMQTLVDVDSVETAEALADILTGNASFYEQEKMPEDLIHAIMKAIRLTLDEKVGESLAQKYFDAKSEEEKKNLSEIKHPVMMALLAADAYDQEDSEAGDRFMEKLAGIDHPSAIKGIMTLANENSVKLDTVANMMSFWQLGHPDDSLIHDIFVEYLSNPEYSPEERAVAAYAIGYENNKDLAISTLQKAQLYENDPKVKRYIREALSKVAD